MTKRCMAYWIEAPCLENTDPWRFVPAGDWQLQTAYSDTERLHARGIESWVEVAAALCGCNVFSCCRSCGWLVYGSWSAHFHNRTGFEEGLRGWRHAQFETLPCEGLLLINY